MRWWDGLGWTEHVALPEDAAEPEEVLLAAAAPAAADDDGLLHPRTRESVFAGSLRGPVRSVAQRARPARDDLLGLLGLQLAGGAAFTLTSWWIAIQGLRQDGGTSVGIFAVAGVLVPLMLIVSLQTRARSDFWHHWCASRGFEPNTGSDGPGRILPANLDRSPLMGPLEDRVVEFAARRRLVDRDAVVGSLLRLPPAEEGVDPRSAPAAVWRSTFVVMSLPEIVAARWPGASIRADHDARRPLQLRAVAGAPVAHAVPAGSSHLATAPDQDASQLQCLVDSRLEHYLAERPMDVDIVGDLLVVMRDGAAREDEPLDELCRDALVLHELLVAAHELSREKQPVLAAVPDEAPVIDLTREGWGGGTYTDGGLADAA